MEFIPIKEKPTAKKKRFKNAKTEELPQVDSSNNIEKCRPIKTRDNTIEIGKKKEDATQKHKNLKLLLKFKDKKKLKGLNFEEEVRKLCPSVFTLVFPRHVTNWCHLKFNTSKALDKALKKMEGNKDIFVVKTKDLTKERSKKPESKKLKMKKEKKEQMKAIKSSKVRYWS